MNLKELNFSEILKKYPELSDFKFDNINPEEYVKFLYEKLGPKLLSKKHDKEFINYLNLKLDAKNKKLIIGYFRYFVIISKFNRIIELHHLTNIKQLTEFNKFKKEINSRTNKLKKDLLKKHPQYKELISKKFDDFINDFENTTDEFNKMSTKLEESQIFNHYNSKKGRPKNALFDKFLKEINEFSEELYPQEKFVKIISPFFIFIANNFSDILDIHDVNSVEKLRQRIKYLKKNQFSLSGK
jgi:hypothetical protein